MEKRLLFLLLLLYSFIALFSTERPTVALVLSGGGAKGFAHIGLLKVIDEVGLEIDHIYGTSMGSIIGGLYASGLSAQEIEKIISKTDWNELLSDKVERNDLYTGQKRWLPTGNFFLPLDNHFIPSLPQGMIMANNLHLHLFYETFRVAHIDDFTQFPIPFSCIATDLETGDLVLLESGSLADALRASSSIPSFFSPFEHNDRVLIDGGITQNLPADIAKAEGADIIIGMKTNTEMVKRDELKNPLSILNQALNIGMQYRQNRAEHYVDILITPDIDAYSILDFKSVEKIIAKGYIEAQKYRSELKALADSLKSCPDRVRNRETLPEKISFNSIQVKNNRYLTAAQVRNYLRLSTNTPYSRDQIFLAFKNAHSSELFDQIYPNIIKDDAGYTLVVNVKETERKHLGVNIIYNEHDQLVAGAILRMRNYLLDKSELYINMQAGGISAFEIDYSKAFLKDNNIYYRLFPYIRRDKINVYDHELRIKSQSYKRTETGLTAGIGIQSRLNTIIEPYLYSYHVKFDRDVAQYDLFDSTNVFTSSGAGIKLYYETLDDYPFYTKGLQIFTKYSTSRVIDEISELRHNKLVTSILYAQPIQKKLSLIIAGEYGSFLKSVPVPQDPFFIGGMDNFLGLNAKERSAPVYRKIVTALRINPIDNLYFDILANYVTYGEADKWLHMDETVNAAGVVLGYKTVIGPARVGFAIDENSRTTGYISIGYDFDSFFLSRR